MKKIALILIFIYLFASMIVSCTFPVHDALSSDETGTELSPNTIAGNAASDHYFVDDFDRDGVVYIHPDVTDLTMYGKYVYGVASNDIRRFPINGGMEIDPEILYQTEHKLDGITVTEDGTLYFFDQTDHKLMAMTIDGEVTASYPLDDKKYSVIAVRGNTAAIANAKGSFWLYDLTRADPASMIEVDERGPAAIRRLEFVDDDTIMLLSQLPSNQADTILYLYELKDKKLTEVVTVNMSSVKEDVTRASIADYNMGTYFYRDWHVVYGAEQAGRIPVIRNLSLHANPETAHNTHYQFQDWVFYVTDTNIFYWSLYEWRFVCEVREDLPFAGGETVTVVMHEAEAAEKAMVDLMRDCRLNHDLKVESMVFPQNQLHEKLNLKLLAGDSDFDLFTPVQAADVIRQDAYLPLNDYPDLMANFAEMLPGVQELVTYDGKVYGVPTHIKMDYYQLAVDAPESVKVLLNRSWTVDDVWVACDELLRLGGDKQLFAEKIGLSGVLDLLADAYTMANFDGLNKTADKNARQNLQTMLKKADEYYRKGVLVGKNGLIRPIGQPGTLQYSAIQTGAALLSSLRMNDSGPAGLSVTVQMINPHSANPAAAAKVLTVLTGEPHRRQLDLFGAPIYDPSIYLWNNGAAYSQSEGFLALADGLGDDYRSSAAQHLAGAMMVDDIKAYQAGEKDWQDLADELYDHLYYRVFE